MPAFIKKSLNSGRQYVQRVFGANDNIAKGDIITNNQLTGFALDRAGGANVIAAQALLGIHIPAECAIMFEHECVTINKAAVQINIGVAVYWDRVALNCTNVAAGNIRIGNSLATYAANATEMDIYFNGAN
jgi:hypothetical protein